MGTTDVETEEEEEEEEVAMDEGDEEDGGDNWWPAVRHCGTKMVLPRSAVFFAEEEKQVHNEISVLLCARLSSAC